MSLFSIFMRTPSSRYRVHSCRRCVVIVVEGWQVVFELGLACELLFSRFAPTLPLLTHLSHTNSDHDNKHSRNKATLISIPSERKSSGKMTWWCCKCGKENSGGGVCTCGMATSLIHDSDIG